MLVLVLTKESPTLLPCMKLLGASPLPDEALRVHAPKPYLEPKEPIRFGFPTVISLYKSLKIGRLFGA